MASNREEGRATDGVSAPRSHARRSGAVPTEFGKLFIVLGLLFCAFLLSFSSSVVAQTKDQAAAAIKQMSPDEIQAKLKELGMSPEDAAAKAQALGIDISSFLQTPELQKPPSTLQNAPPPKLTADTTKPIVVVPPIPSPTIPGQLPWYMTPDSLSYFGYEVFDGVPSAFEPTATGPADQEYLIGPGDVLRLAVWGQAELQYELTVDDVGKIFIPTIGQVVVTGMTLEKATERLKVVLSKSYSGLVAKNPTVWMDLAISQLRPKRIFIMGEVRKPGGYTVSSYATVFSSLYAIGGPTIKGSLREVRVVRGSKVVAHVDLYEYFTGASEVSDIRVQTNDIVYVPIRGKTVTLRGEVKHPGIFELKEGETLKDLVRIAGGFSATASVERILIDRIVPFEERVPGEAETRVVTVDYAKLTAQKKSILLDDKDDVQVGSFIDLQRNYVKIDGSVRRPGRYQFEKYKTLKSLIVAADSLQPEAFLERATIRRTRPDSTLAWYEVDLRSVLGQNPSEDFSLQPWDAVRIYSRYEISPRLSVQISGHVKNPGTYAYADSMTLSKLIFKAGGMQDSLFRARTFMKRADLLRLTEDGITKKTIPFDLDSLLAGVPGVDRPLQPLDEVHVYGIEVEKVVDKFVTVLGKVNNPGTYPLTEGMTVGDVLLLAGGLTEDAYKIRVEISRMKARGSGDDTLSQIIYRNVPDFSQDRNLYRSGFDESQNDTFRLEHRDQIFFREDPDFLPQQTVAIGGEVRFPGRFALRVRNERISDVIARCGGPTASAFPEGAKVLRNGKRVIIDLVEAIKNPRAENDFILQPEDSIYIPRRPNAVYVGGEVGNVGYLGYIEGDKVWDYISRAGWLTDSSSVVLVASPTGDVQQLGTSWLNRFFQTNPKVLDGSSIFVTRQPREAEGPPVDWGTTLKDIFAITASMVTVLVLAKQL